MRQGAWLLATLVALCAAGCGGVPTPAVNPQRGAAAILEVPGAAASEAGLPATECERAATAFDWQTAAGACEGLDTRADLAQRLTKAFLAEGRSALSGGDVQTALQWFERARAQRPDDVESVREYVLAMAYRAGEIALADASWDEAVAKFTAVQTADPLYLSWLPERAPRRRRADTQVAWGRALLADRQLSEAEQHCEQARQLQPDLPDAGECLAAIAAMRTPTPTPTATPTPTRTLPVAPPRAPAPPRPPSPPPSPQATTDTVPRAPVAPSVQDQQAPPPPRPPAPPPAPPPQAPRVPAAAPQAPAAQAPLVPLTAPPPPVAPVVGATAPPRPPPDRAPPLAPRAP